ncbi:transcription factor GAGA isoform X1 [Phlebotomus papatasi]|uniref:transcription factor GAGA isoform X1 n=1 Tax=Phlebotomus papatasi TaxID=29031 RepID=UPI0024833595|nr:transcription factor GAGA isoform X1 [Phlebotomus papatasi]
MSLPLNSLYSLTWGDYGTSLVSAVQLLRCHGDLVDCTLAAGGRSFPAHKIVLCAASPYLLDLLKNTPCKHPVVMLAGVNANDLEALLEFVYRGEVSVDHSQLPSLLQAAHCLNIQGLAPQTVSHKDDQYQIQLHPTIVPQHIKTVIDVGNNACKSEQLITTIQSPAETVQAQIVEEISPDQIPEDVTKDVISHLLPTRKRKPRTRKPSTANAKVPRTEIKQEAETTENGVSTGKQEQKQDVVKPKSRSQSEQPASCPICGAIIRQSRNLRRHLELRHFSRPGAKKEKKSKSNSVSSESASTSTGTVTVVMAPPGTPQQQQQQQQQLVEAQQQVVSQAETTDGSNSLSVTHVQAIQGHQLTIGNLNQASNNGEQQLEENPEETHTELFRINAIYAIQEATQQD